MNIYNRKVLNSCDGYDWVAKELLFKKFKYSLGLHPIDTVTVTAPLYCKKFGQYACVCGCPCLFILTIAHD